MDLKGRNIIITGAARIGGTTAEELAGRGANLALVSLKAEDVSEAVEKCRALGARAEAYGADLSLSDKVSETVGRIRKDLGPISGLVHMAAIYRASPWPELSEKDWDLNLNVIAKSAFLMAKAAGDEMRSNSGEAPKGKMIFFTDWSILTRPYRDYLPYNSAKSAVLGLARSLAKELAPDVLVNSIAPGPILQPPGLSEEENEEVLAGTLLKRWGGAEEIAKAVVYLFESDFITGQNLMVDGGRSLA